MLEYLYLHFFSNNHDLLCQLHRVEVFQRRYAQQFFGFNVPRTLLVSPIESRVLAMLAQPGVGLAAPWRLTFSDVLCAGFAM